MNAPFLFFGLQNYKAYYIINFMKYIKSVLEYLFVFERGKRFFLTALVILPVAALAGFALPLGDYFAWFIGFNGQYENYTALLKSSFSGFNIIVYLGLLVLIVLTVAAVASMMNYCLRTGGLRFGNLLRNINDNFFPALYSSVIFGGVALLVQFLMTLFLYIVNLIKTAWVVTALGVFVLLLFLFLLLLTVSAAMIALPISSYYGVGPVKSFGLSIQKTQADFWKIMLALSLPLLVCVGLGFALGAIGNFIASVIVSALIYDFMLTYLITLAILVFYDIEGITRDDTPRSYLYRKYR